MSISLLVAAVGAVGAVVAAAVLVARCTRAPSGGLIAWTVAMFGLAIALCAQAAGHGIGFGPVAFRAMEIGAGVIAPIALATGLIEVVGKSLPARFAARLCLSAVAFVSVVIFGSDPLSASAFSKAWPDPSSYYQIIPNKLLEYLLAPVTALVAVTAVAVVLVRLMRDPAWKQALVPVIAAGAGALAVCVPGLATVAAGHLGTKLPIGSLFAPLTFVAAALTWLAGSRVARLHSDMLRQRHEAEDDGDWGHERAWAGGPETGDFEPVGAGRDRYPGDGSYRDGAGPDYRDAAYPAADLGHDGYDEPYRRGDTDAGYEGYPDDTYGGLAAAPGLNGAGAASRPGADSSGVWRPDGLGADGKMAPLDPYGAYQAAAADDQAGAQLFGQIAIYTLLEDRVAEFDRLTMGVVKQVRSQEPDTLVYIVHAVPSAPMQRILYEVYRDRTAYDEHKRQPYITKFEADRRPYVLATNVIELGLQQAKVSPLPSISALLTDTGFDLLSDTGFGQPGFGPRSAGGPGGSGPGGPGPGAKRPR